MPYINHFCLSDVHFGEDDNLLTDTNPLQPRPSETVAKEVEIRRKNLSDRINKSLLFF